MSADVSMEIEATTSSAASRVPSMPAELFDAAKFPFDATTRAAILERRKQLDGQLFFDLILGNSGAGEASALFPPKNMDEFRRLRELYTASTQDSLRRACITYYLLKCWDVKTSIRYRRAFPIPPQYSLLTEAFWHFDNNKLKEAVAQLADPRITPDNSSKILRTLEAAGDYQSILTYIQTSRPILMEQWEIDLHGVALSKSSLRGAWAYQRSLHGETRKSVIEKIVQHALIPKPIPKTLEQLLVFPFDAFEQDAVQGLALDPPSAFTGAGAPHALPIIQDLVITRLIAVGQFSEAAKLNVSLPPPIGDEAKAKAAARYDTLTEVIQTLGPMLRAEVEQQLKGQGIDPFTSKKPASSRTDTPRKQKPKPIQPLFTPPVPTAPSPSLLAPSHPTAVPNSPRPPLDVPIIPPTITSNPSSRFNSPPPTGTISYIRSQGAPSPASPAFVRMQPPLNAPASPVSVQKTKNAFFDPSTTGPKTSLFGDVNGQGGGRKAGNGFGASLRAKSSLSKMISHSRKESVDEDFADIEENTNDEIDSFVRSGARHEFGESTRPPTIDEPQPADPLDTLPDSNIRLRPAPPPRTTSPKRRGTKRAASTQLLPGAFPHDAVMQVDNTEHESQDTSLGAKNAAYPPLPSLSSAVPRKRSKGTPREKSPELDLSEHPSIPGGFGVEEENDEVGALPSRGRASAKGGRKKRAASVESDVSEVSTAGGGAVRRSGRLSRAGSDVESLTSAVTEKVKKGDEKEKEKKPSSRASTRSARSKKA